MSHRWPSYKSSYRRLSGNDCHWPSGDFYGAETIIKAHGELNNPTRYADTPYTLPDRKKLEECLADVEKAVVQMSSSELEGELERFFKYVVLRRKVSVLRKTRHSYMMALCYWGGAYLYRGEEPGVRVPESGPCFNPFHRELEPGETSCRCGIFREYSRGGAVKYYWLVAPRADPGHRCPACGEGCLMPHDWALKMVKEKGL